MPTPKFQCLRRLSPFQGTLQAIVLDNGRAFSADGLYWQIELLSEIKIKNPVWSHPGESEGEQRFFAYAHWSQSGGVERLPINPMLGNQSEHPALATLLDTLQQLPPMPFPAADPIELWLLDRRDQPLALLRSRAHTQQLETVHDPSWQPTLFNDLSFVSHQLLEYEQQGPEDAPQRHRNRLVRLIRDAAGSPSRAQWFRRESDGSGNALSGVRISSELYDRTLPPQAFPELLLREQWEDEQAQGLVDDFFTWQAPMLLTLPSLCAATRERLEELAVQRPVPLYLRRKILPEIRKRSCVEPAMVEAVLRLAE